MQLNMGEYLDNDYMDTKPKAVSDRSLLNLIIYTG